MSAVATTVKTADALLKTGAGKVHWMTASNAHATATVSVDLYDGLSAAGTLRYRTHIGDIDAAENTAHYRFNPPLKFSTGIYLDLTNGTPSVTVGFV